MKHLYTVALAAFFAIFLLPLAALAAKSEPGKNDFTPEFVARCKSRAEAGDAEGQFLYAKALFAGWGVEKDKTKAIEWWRKAADLGNPHAMRIQSGILEGKGERGKSSLSRRFWSEVGGKPLHPWRAQSLGAAIWGVCDPWEIRGHPCHP